MARKKTNKLGVKNSLVNNINAHKKRGDSKRKEQSNVTKQSYKAMQEGWGHKRPRKAAKKAAKTKKATKRPPKAKKVAHANRATKARKP